MPLVQWEEGRYRGRYPIPVPEHGIAVPATWRPIMKYHIVGLSLLAFLGAAPAWAAERLPALRPDQLSPEQKAINDAIASGPRGNSSGPFQSWLRSPELADRLQKVGEYVRFQTSLPKPLNEFAILVAGRYWNSAFEWAYHYPLAIRGGVEASVLKDLSDGRAPGGMSDDEALVYGFSTELRRDKAVSDATYARALARFGERGIIDLVAVNGYYDVVCMTLNVAQVPVPAGSTAPPLASLK